MTLPLLLAAATPTAEATGPLEGLKQTFVHFGVEPKYLIMQVVSFLIVLVVLYKFGIKPVTATRSVTSTMAGMMHSMLKINWNRRESFSGLKPNKNLSGDRL